MCYGGRGRGEEGKEKRKVPKESKKNIINCNVDIFHIIIKI